MKTLATLFLLLCASICWGQVCVPDNFGNCGDSPFWSEHILVDSMRLFDTPAFQWSQYSQPLCGSPCFPPFWLSTQSGWTRPFELDAIEIDPRDNNAANGQFNVASGLVLPWIPPQPNIFVELFVSWMPVHEGPALARLRFKAHFLDDGSDATHTVLLIGYGLPAHHRLPGKAKP